MTDPILTESTRPIATTRPDLLLFGAAFISGLAFHLTFWTLDLPQIFATTAIVLVLLSYAVIASRIPRLRVRLDQAGDNAYYLGLLFTLESMSLALYEFGASQGSGADAIIENFGIALASTIAGIFLRVILHQMRIDPADIEGMTRIELADAAQRVRTSLDLVTTDLARFHFELGQRATDVVTSVATTASSRIDELFSSTQARINELASTSASSQQETLSRTSDLLSSLEALSQQAIAAADRLKSIEPPPLALARRLDKAGSALDEVATRISAVPAAIDEICSRLSEVLSKLISACERITEVAAGTGTDREESSRAIQSFSNHLTTSLAQVEASLRSSQTLLAQLEEQSARTAAASTRAQEASIEVLESLTRSVHGLESLVRDSSS